MTVASGLPQLLVVGLGNLPFPQTRHSIGHLIIDALAARLCIHMSSDRTMGGVTGRSKVTLGETTVSLTLLKPKPLMNITGPSVAGALRNSVKAPDAMIIIHDSLSHKPKALSPKMGGSANGHNGVRSVISALRGETNFHRFRIGIGRGPGDAAEYVLAKLPLEEKFYWNGDGIGLDLICNELERIARKQLENQGIP
ncbi:peptidyl-tRNA hydrolase [Rhizopogon vinicolor AM-OR11-026]|uniref:peptidyl-tRNA hydrolase n=1 Tax=Rhizopogon vinicolor AM-OR11-026 TaxID=1314800 RepID=A0A1B7MXL1_9AGAM|nr:peptidyl-tRNA hydrolase [Rhizopogon vinicolor AM-OR11-026]